MQGKGGAGPRRGLHHPLRSTTGVVRVHVHVERGLTLIPHRGGDDGEERARARAECPGGVLLFGEPGQVSVGTFQLGPRVVRETKAGCFYPRTDSSAPPVRAMLKGFFGGKRPPETPPSQGATRGADARARASSVSAEAAGGVVLGPSEARSTSERNPERRDPDDIPDGDMPALFERCQDLLAKTAKRADIGAKTVRGPRPLTFRLSLSARRPRGTPQSIIEPPENVLFAP